jgi:hypothetical protein
MFKCITFDDKELKKMKQRIHQAIVLSFFFLLSFSLLGQEKWMLYKETDGIKISYRKEICPIPNMTKGSKEKYLFKIENITDKELWVSWNFLFWINGRCIGCDNGEEYKREYNLMPHQSIEAACNDRNDLQVTIRMIDIPGAKSKLEKFEIENIQVDEIKR